MCPANFKAISVDAALFLAPTVGPGTKPTNTHLTLHRVLLMKVVYIILKMVCCT